MFLCANIQQSNGTSQVNNVDASDFLCTGEQVYNDDRIVEGTAVQKRKGRHTYVEVREISHYLVETLRADLGRARSVRASLRLALGWSVLDHGHLQHQNKGGGDTHLRPTWFDCWQAGRSELAVTSDRDPDDIETLHAWAAGFILLGIAHHLRGNEQLCRYCWRHALTSRQRGRYYCREHARIDSTRAANAQARRVFYLLQLAEPELIRLYMSLISMVGHGSSNVLTGYALSPFFEAEPGDWRTQLSALLRSTPAVLHSIGDEVLRARTWPAAAMILQRELDPDNYTRRWSVWQLKLQVAERWNVYETSAHHAARPGTQLRAILARDIPSKRSRAWQVAELLERHKNRHLSRAEIAREVGISRAAVTKLFRTHRAFFQARQIAIPHGR